MDRIKSEDTKQSTSTTVASPKTAYEHKIPITFTFDGNRVHANWYHPVMSGHVCTLCGKRCRERGVATCVNVNPYCG